MARTHAYLTVMTGGLIAGGLDITYAMLFAASRGMPPDRLLQTVATGLLGPAAYTGGWATALLGLALHFCLAGVFAAAFYFASQRRPALIERALLMGVIYGLGVFAVMNFIVLPLSAFPYPIRFSPLATTTDLLSHMFLFGVPIALAARRALTPAMTPAH